ncbi:MAG: NADH-quinone oxidoreductase subunit J [Vicinamibacterales bacterium]|nr:NADH-quinone oxidoreductase subunit J [Vicinamibacterales bacterium]
MGSDQLLFVGFGALALLGALAVVAQPNPVYSVIALIVSFFGLSGLYVLLESPFVAVVQIIIYAGAIMVLFLFVVMLLNATREDGSEWDRAHPYYRPGPMRLGAVLAVLFGVQMIWALTRTVGLGVGVGETRPAVESVRDVGRVLFTDYMFAFEVTSILILAAMVGAVVLARRREE